MSCVNGELVYHAGAFGTRYYTMTPNDMEAALLSSAGFYQNNVFKNAAGTHFFTVGTKFFNGKIDGVSAANTSLYPLNGPHVDVLTKVVFPPPATPDADSDGYTICDDCRDDLASVNPGMTEICGDGLDNDCANGADCADGACSGDPTCTQNIEPDDYPRDCKLER